jgi:hypothetical protein
VPACLTNSICRPAKESAPTTTIHPKHAGKPLTAAERHSPHSLTCKHMTPTFLTRVIHPVACLANNSTPRRRSYLTKIAGWDDAAATHLQGRLGEEQEEEEGDEEEAAEDNEERRDLRRPTRSVASSPQLKTKPHARQTGSIMPYSGAMQNNTRTSRRDRHVRGR